MKIKQAKRVILILLALTLTMLFVFITIYKSPDNSLLGQEVKVFEASAAFNEDGSAISDDIYNDTKIFKINNLNQFKSFVASLRDIDVDRYEAFYGQFAGKIIELNDDIDLSNEGESLAGDMNTTTITEG